MLTKLKIKNFKAIGETGVDLELKPLTILIGPNGSGKSSILEAICLLSQQREQSAFSLQGEFVRFPGLDDIAHQHELERWISWELHKDSGWGIRYEFKPDSNEQKETVLKKGKDFLLLVLEGDRRSGHVLKVQVPGESPSKPVGNVLTPLSGSPFRNTAINLGLVPNTTTLPEDKATRFIKAGEIADDIGKDLAEKAFFLKPVRGEIPAQSDTVRIGRWVGTNGEWLISILSLLSSPKYETQRNQIGAWAEKFGLPKLSAGVSGPGVVTAVYSDPELKTHVNLALAGHGSKQVASIITQLFWAPSSSLLMIEEPEISLHPEAQVLLVEMFAEAIKEHKQIMVTTHSHFLLLALGQAVQKGLLKTGDIAVYHITKGGKGTKATRVRLSKRGFPLGWPPSFEKVERELARAWAKGLSGKEQE